MASRDFEREENLLQNGILQLCIYKLSQSSKIVLEFAQTKNELF